MNVLSVQNVTKRFGGLLAVNDISFDVEEGEILSIIGPNGAGKSTLFKIISSFLSPTAGRVLFRDKVISGQKPHTIARFGVVRTFQETSVFREMTALENVIVAHHLQARSGTFAIFVGTSVARFDDCTFRESAIEILDYLGLGHVKHERARNLPHGHLRALGIAIAMAAQPKVLLLDEPFTGMNPEETDRAVTMVEGIRDRGITIL
jgi:branched-chain amino acid transport system ATP-binding protein